MLGFVLFDHFIDFIAEGFRLLEQSRDGETNPDCKNQEVHENQAVDTRTEIASDRSGQEVEAVHLCMVDY